MEEAKKPEAKPLTAKQKLVAFLVAVAIAAAGFPIYWSFTHGPSDAVEHMFTAMSFASFDKSGDKELKAIAQHCTSEEKAAEVTIGLGFGIMAKIGEQEWDHDILETKKDGDKADVKVKIYAENNKDKNFTATFKLKKEAGFFGEWKVDGCACDD